MLISALTTLFGALLTWGLSQGTLTLEGTPVLLYCALIAFGVQWVAFIPAYLKQTERFYDLTGSLTYISCALLILSQVGLSEPRALLLSALVMIWALRLGLFLFRRVHQDGGDGRFDTLKPRFGAFLTAWTVQGLWVLLTSSAAWVGALTTTPQPLGWVELLGGLVWLTGFSIEVIADQQKRSWRAHKREGERFICSGLWRYSRHPNYFGEITLWVGVALIALPVMSGWGYLGLLSPVFVYVLLTRISGVPLLEARAQERWGSDPRYQAYLQQTSRLCLWWPKR
jgi:steroid 5-alpha reductase family enzyme